MMRYRTSKIKAVISKQYSRCLATVPTRNASAKIFMGVRGTQNEDLLFQRFIAVETGEKIEEFIGPINELRVKLCLAIRYNAFLKQGRSRAPQAPWDDLVGTFKAFALGEKYISPHEEARRAAAERAYIKTMVDWANSNKPQFNPKVVSKISEIKSKSAAADTKPATAISKSLPAPKVTAQFKDKMPPIKPVTKKSMSTAVSIKEVVANSIVPGIKGTENAIVNKSKPRSGGKEEDSEEARLARHIADFEILANLRPEDDPNVYSSPRAIMTGERKMPIGALPAGGSTKSKAKKINKDEIDPALTALIEKARARGKRTSSFLSPEEIPYLIKDSQVHRTVLFLGTSYMFYNYPSTIYYTAYIMFAYFVYLCVTRYNKYMVWISKDFEYVKFLSWYSEAYQRDLHRRMQARYPHKVKKPGPKGDDKK